MMLKHWSAAQVLNVAMDAKAPWGQGWVQLSPSTKRCMVHAKAMNLVLSQLREEIEIDAIRELVTAAEKEAGL